MPCLALRANRDATLGRLHRGYWLAWLILPQRVGIVIQYHQLFLGLGRDLSFLVLCCDGGGLDLAHFKLDVRGFVDESFLLGA